MSGMRSSRKKQFDLPGELGNGLIICQAEKEDIETAADFIADIHGEPALGISARDLMNGVHPASGVDDFVLIVDEDAGNKIVATAGLVPQTWAYDGIPFSVGNPEFISTAPDYRRQGLMRTVIDGLHSLSAYRGDLVQAIQGLRWFYRQFGYEYALNPGPIRQLHLSDVPALPEDETEPYQIRRSTDMDIGLIMPLYERQCAGYLITNVLNESFRQGDISGYSPGSDLGDWTYTIVDTREQFIGYYSTWGDPWGSFMVKELATEKEEALPQVLPTILRFIQAQQSTYAAAFDGKGPTRITFELGANHPVYRFLETSLGQLQSRQDWYIRIPDLPKFISHIKPVLEHRLMNSVMRNFSGELKMTFFRGGLRLIFDQGKLTQVASREATGENGTFEMTSFPPLVFLKLLFGYRSLEELRYAYPDCWAGEQDTLLLNALFPKQPSWLRML